MKMHAVLASVALALAGSAFAAGLAAGFASAAWPFRVITTSKDSSGARLSASHEAPAATGPTWVPSVKLAE